MGDDTTGEHDRDAEREGHDRGGDHDSSAGPGRPVRLEHPVAPRRLQRWLLVGLVVFTALHLLGVWLTDATLRPTFFVVQLPMFVLAVLGGVVLLRRPQVVDRDGVAPGAFRRRIPWSDVDHVRRPTRWQPYVTLVLRDGRERALLVEGEEGARDVARIGDVPLRD